MRILEAIRFAIHVKDMGVVSQAIYQCPPTYRHPPRNKKTPPYEQLISPCQGRHGKYPKNL